MERTLAKQVHAAGECSIVRAAGGRMLWMTAADSRAVKPGTEILVEGSEHEILGVCCVRAILAGPIADDGDSLFDESDMEVGTPRCPDCGVAMDAVFNQDGSYNPATRGIEFYGCPECLKKWYLVDGELRAEAETRGRGRKAARTTSGAFGVGAPGDEAERSPGVALGSKPDGMYVALANWNDSSRAEVEKVLEHFSPHVGPADHRGDALYWTIETDEPFKGDKGRAFAGLVLLHQMISRRGMVPSGFRDLRDWISGVYM
jgi:hypothetical protein